MTNDFLMSPIMEAVYRAINNFIGKGASAITTTPQIQLPDPDLVSELIL